jgi:valyl-tRNA synthetase
MPFITEEIFCTIQNEEPSLMLSPWPSYRSDFVHEKEAKGIEAIKEAIRLVRNMRAEQNVPPKQELDIIIVSMNKEIEDILFYPDNQAFFGRLFRASELVFQEDKEGVPADALALVSPDATIYVALTKEVNATEENQERERLTKEAARLDEEIARVTALLTNPRFLEKAPPEKIASEREKEAKYRQMKEQVIINLQQLRDGSKL